MITLFIILMVTACIGLGFMVLIQNPKGGGLNANVGGLSNNFMGVKQTTDVLEKGTWIFVLVIALLAMSSTLFLKSSSGSSTEKDLINKVNTSTTTAPQQAVPVQQAPSPQQAPANQSTPVDKK
jgi:preprotein translocase subunit SecG